VSVVVSFFTSGGFVKKSLNQSIHYYKRFLLSTIFAI
jgi:hypothetical protein